MKFKNPKLSKTIDTSNVEAAVNALRWRYPGLMSRMESQLPSKFMVSYGFPTGGARGISRFTPEGSPLGVEVGLNRRTKPQTLSTVSHELTHVGESLFRPQQFTSSLDKTHHLGKVVRSLGDHLQADPYNEAVREAFNNIVEMYNNNPSEVLARKYQRLAVPAIRRAIKKGLLDPKTLAPLKGALKGPASRLASLGMKGLPVLALGMLGAQALLGPGFVEDEESM